MALNNAWINIDVLRNKLHDAYLATNNLSKALIDKGYNVYRNEALVNEAVIRLPVAIVGGDEQFETAKREIPEIAKMAGIPNIQLEINQYEFGNASIIDVNKNVLGVLYSEDGFDKKVKDLEHAWNR